MALVPFSIAHTLGIAALRPLWFAGILGERYVFPLTPHRLTYEFAKDIVNYAMLSAAVVAMRYLMQRATGGRSPPPCGRRRALPERFAVRKRGGSEVMVVKWPTSTGSRRPATTPSCMSAATPSRDPFLASPGSKGELDPAPCGSTNRTW